MTKTDNTYRALSLILILFRQGPVKKMAKRTTRSVLTVCKMNRKKIRDVEREKKLRGENQKLFV